MKNFVVGKYEDYEEYYVVACYDSIDKAKNYIQKHAKDARDYEITVIREDNVLGKFSLIDVEKYTNEYDLASFIINSFDRFMNEFPTHKMTEREHNEYMKCKGIVNTFNILYQEDKS